MEPDFELTTLEAIIAAVPYLIGYHPQPSSVVVIGRKDLNATVAVCIELDDTFAGYAVPPAFVDKDLTDAVFLLGFGAKTAVEPLMAGIAFAADLNDIDVAVALVVHDGRYWDLTSDTPAEGVAVPTGPSAVEASMTYHGMQVFPSRTAIAELFTPVTGDTRDAAEEAITAARQTLADATTDTARVAFTADAVELLHQAIADTDPPGIDATARLAVALTVPVVRDVAMAAVDHTHARSCERLWIHVVRHAPPGLRTAPAVLAAYSAWRGGAGHIAAAALAAIDEDGDPVAGQLEELLTAAVHPATVPAFQPGELLQQRT